MHTTQYTIYIPHSILYTYHTVYYIYTTYIVYYVYTYHTVCYVYTYHIIYYVYAYHRGHTLLIENPFMIIMESDSFLVKTF